jgi:hypothetical protein
VDRVSRGVPVRGQSGELSSESDLR